jgi:hypothetical protein
MVDKCIELNKAYINRKSDNHVINPWTGRKIHVDKSTFLEKKQFCTNLGINVTKPRDEGKSI